MITASTPEHIKSNCQEFFQRTYVEWQANEERVQNLQTSQLWADKYWNATTDDSPYDIMSDLSREAELSFNEVEPAVTIVLYDLPAFSNSKQNLQDLATRATNESNVNNNRVGWSTTNNVWNNNWWNSNNWGVSLWWGSDWWSVSLWWNNGWWNSASDGASPLTKWSQGFSMEWWLDYLVEWLWANSVVKNNSLFYWGLCVDDEEEPEPEEEVPVDAAPTRSATEPWRDLSNLWSEELKTLVANLEAAVDRINDQPEIKENQTIGWNMNVTSSSQSNPEADQERARQEILTCFESCKSIKRLDQRASCELMCACWEWKSKIFDPEKNPWLWPIVMLKYCTVPAVDMKFSVWWKSVFSLEEMINEIYGVVDKLSREWKLGIWTQQRNFLDSSTKMMKVADTFAFSIDVEYIDIADQLPNYSTHYREFVAERENEKSLQAYWISNSLDNPATKNRFRVIWERWSTVKWYDTASNPDVLRQDLEDLDVAPSPLVDLSEYSREDRYATLSELMHNWDDMQADFREKSKWFIEDMTSYANALASKK